MSDPEGQKSEDGLGKDGTIPNSDTGVAAGFQPGGSNFEPEEDGPLDDGDADALNAEAEDDEISPRDPEAGGGPELDDLDVPSHDPEAPGDPSLDDL